MKLIYTGRSPTDAHLFAALLAEQEIPREVRGEPLWQHHEPRLSKNAHVTTVWVSEEDAEKAAAMALEYRSEQPDDDEHVWHCSSCGEGNPARFDECWNCGTPQNPAVSEPTADLNGLMPDSLVLEPEQAFGDERTEEASSPSTTSPRVPIAEEPPVLPGRLPVPWTFPWGTVLVTVICTLIWHGLSGDPNPQGDAAMERWGWRSAHDLWGGAWWALLTGSFVHADFDHLYGNMLWLWIFGIRLEQAVGTWRWLLFVVASAIISAGVDQAWLGEHSYGASGVVNAAFGLFVVAGTSYRLMSLWIYIPLCLYFFATGTLYDAADLIDEVVGTDVVSPVANVCHLTGLAFGALTGLAFVERWKPRVCAIGFAALTVATILPLVWAPWSYEWCLNRAELADGQSHAEEALAWFDRAISLKPEEATAWTRRAELHLQANRFESALADANAAVAIEEGLLKRQLADGEGVAGVAEVVGEKSADPTTDVPPERPAHGAGEESDPIEPPDPDPQPGTAFSKVTGTPFLVRGKIYYALCQYAEAERDLTQAILVSQDGSLARSIRGALRWELSRYDEAQIDLESSLAVDPSDVWTRLVRGAMRREVSEPFAARSDLGHVVEVLQKPVDDDSLSYAAAVYLAWAYDESGDPESCEAFATRALSTVPHDWDTLARRGHARIQRKDAQAALADADASLAVNPRHVFGHCVRGLALMQLKRSEEAESAFTRAVEINPRYVMALRGRAAARFARGQSTAALDDLNRALQLNPRCAPAYLERGRVQSKLGNESQAEADRQTGEALDPELRDHAAAISGAERVIEAE